MRLSRRTAVHLALSPGFAPAPVTSQGNRVDRAPAWTRTALRCYPAAAGRASGAGSAAPPRPALALIQPFGPRSPDARVQPAAPNRPLLRPAADPRVGPLQLGRTHGQRIAQTPDRETAVAHSRPVADSGRRRSRVCGGAGTWSPWRSGRAPRSLQHWRRPTGGSSCSRTAGQASSTGRRCPGASGGGETSPRLNLEPCGHCSSHSAELG